MNDKKELSARIRSRAHELGFDLIGIAPARRLSEHEERINTWCLEGMNGMMSYLSRDIDKRTDPRKLFPGTKSVIVTGLSYNTDRKQKNPGVPVISKYAFGKNYHDVISGKLNSVIEFIKESVPGTIAKAYVDSEPLLEKAWARESGLGWPGKHSVLINREIGSFFFIGIILTDLVLSYDKPVRTDFCGSCRLCMDACPTSAIRDNRTLDTRRCLANLTIESRDAIPEEFVSKTMGRIYGCDICQDACPWNKHARKHSTPEFEISPEIENMTAGQWHEMTSEQFKRLFKGTPLERKKYEVFKENINRYFRTINSDL